MAIKIRQLEDLAAKTIGDAQTPNLFFVTRDGIVVLVSVDFVVAWHYFQQLASTGRNREECALEDRQTGVLASVSPMDDDPDARLQYQDDTHTFGYR